MHLSMAFASNQIVTRHMHETALRPLIGRRSVTVSSQKKTDQDILQQNDFFADYYKEAGRKLPTKEDYIWTGTVHSRHPRSVLLTD